MAEERTYSPYRWVLLALSWLFMVSLSWGQMLVAPLAKQLMTDLNIGHGALIAVYGAPQIITLFTAIPGGILADKFGYKRMITTAGIIAGVFGILRGFSTTYAQFFAFSVLHGVGLAVTGPPLVKLVRAWFPPRQIGTATGLNASGFGVGMTIALATTYPLFGFDWRVAFYTISGLVLVVTVVWAILGREEKREIKKRSLIKDLSVVSRNSDVWICGFVLFFIFGGLHTFTSQFPVALETARSVNPATAGVLASMISIGLIVSNAFGPMLSDRIGLRRPLLILCPALAAIAIYLAWILPFGLSTSVLSFAAGIFIGTVVPLAFAILTEHEGIASEVLGTASGLQRTIMAVGFYTLPLLGGFISEWKPGYNATFLYASILVLIVIIFGFLVSETGPKTYAKGKR